MPYADKRGHYDRQNLLARSLHENAYRHNPGFRGFRNESGLPFKAHTAFKKTDVKARQKLYLKLAERIWSPEALHWEAGS